MAYVVGWGLTEQALTERAPGARSWGAPRAWRGPGVGPTTLTAQGRQIRAPPPAHALGLASRLLITAGPLLGPHRRTDLKIDLYQGKDIRSHTRGEIGSENNARKLLKSCMTWRLDIFSPFCRFKDLVDRLVDRLCQRPDF